MSYLKKYFAKVPENDRTPGAIAYMASFDAIAEDNPDIVHSIIQELKAQRSHLKLIASENYSSLPVQLAMGNLLTDKYSEGIVGHRFYAGCEHVDAIEGRANALAKELFQAEHAYVQPHSGADANLVAFWAILIQRVQTPEIARLQRKNLDELTPDEYEQVRQLLVNQKMMGMALGSGGHLTHGYKHNMSSKMMRASHYDVDSSGTIDYAALQRQVREEKPLILVAGYSAYPRKIDFAKMREIADSVGAVLMVDMAHFAGLVAGKVFTGVYNPVPYAHIVTSTTHKTLRGPRGGMILCKAEFKEAVDKGCPLALGGPLPHVMAAKAIAFKEALRPDFSTYAHQIVANSQALAAALQEKGVRVLTGGTDNHLIVLDVMASFGFNGRQTETLLREAKMTVNRNAIPHDVNGPWYTSGIRMGTAALTTLGMKEREMKEIAAIFVELLKEASIATDPKTGGPSRSKLTAPVAALQRAETRIKNILEKFPLYPELVID